LRPDSFLVDPQLAQASGIIGAGWAILAAVEELEELRQLGNMFPTSSSVQQNPRSSWGVGAQEAKSVCKCRDSF